MKLKLFITSLSIAASGFAIADSYQAEINAAAARYGSDVGGSHSKMLGAEGIYYFKAVSTDNVPLAEAAFLGKNSNVFAQFVETPRQYNYPRQRNYILGAEFYIPENFLYVRAGASRYSTRSYDNNDWFTSVGITPIDGLLITTEYSHDQGYDANIAAKYVTSIGQGKFINLEAGAKDFDWGTYKTIAGDFYFDNTFSLGGAIEDGAFGTDYTVRTRKFFSEKFSGDLSYTDTDYHGSEVALGLTLRF